MSARSDRKNAESSSDCRVILCQRFAVRYKGLLHQKCGRAQRGSLSASKRDPRTPDNVDAYVSAALRRVGLRLGVNISDIEARPVRGEAAEQAHILRRVQETADNLGIDVEAPFRAKPKGSRS
jgi:hypothetical protein